MGTYDPYITLGILEKRNIPMLTIMLFAMAAAVLPALLKTTLPVPAPFNRSEEDVRVAYESVV